MDEIIERLKEIERKVDWIGLKLCDKEDRLAGKEYDEITRLRAELEKANERIIAGY